MSIELPLDEHLKKKFLNVQVDNQMANLALCDLVIQGNEKLGESIYDFITALNSELKPEIKEDGTKTYNQITPYIRIALLRSTKIMKGDDQCSDIIKETLELYKENCMGKEQIDGNPNIIK
jgi:hypothetical protein